MLKSHSRVNQVCDYIATDKEVIMEVSLAGAFNEMHLMIHRTSNSLVNIAPHRFTHPSVIILPLVHVTNAMPSAYFIHPRK